MRLLVTRLGLGTAGTFVFVAQIASRFFANDVGMRLALLGAGTLLVALAVIVARLRTPLDNR